MPEISGPFPPPAVPFLPKPDPFDSRDQQPQSQHDNPISFTSQSRSRFNASPSLYSEMAGYYEGQINFAEPRPRAMKADTTRRPASNYPAPNEEPIYHPQRNFTDPTPQLGSYGGQEQHIYMNAAASSSQHQLDVDLDVYAQDYDVEDEIRQPTLSFATTSTIDSTTSSPSISEAYTYGPERSQIDHSGKQPELEPRIRVRTNTGRQNAYSSAESSMASAPYSYHAYSDNSYHPHPPPQPVAADATVGFQRNTYNRASAADDTSSNGCQTSPPSSYDYLHHAWRSPVMNRNRSDSVTTADSSTSTSESQDDRLSAGFAHSFSYLSTSANRYPWDEEPVAPPTEPAALALVDDGRSAILDRDKLEAMGGLRALSAMSDDDLLRLPRFTHLLLPAIGPELLEVLPMLLDVLSTTLVVLDIANNGFTVLPNGLRYCSALEELNLSGNPLRQLPPFMGDCTNLRMFLADGCDLQNLPQEMMELGNLHGLCVRGNRLVQLPPWLCRLHRLETLRIDNNPFAPQWAGIVAPILASTLSQTPTHSRTASQHSAHLRQPAGQNTPGPDFAQQQRANRNGIQGLSRRREQPLPSSLRAPNRSVTGPAPASELFSANVRVSNIRRAQSAVGHYTDESDLDHSDSKSGKWGFLRKMSMSRMRSDKDAKSHLNASAAANSHTLPPMTHAPSAPIVPQVTSPKRPPMPQPFRSAQVIPTSRNLTIEENVPPMHPGPAFGTSYSSQTSMRSKRSSFLVVDPSPPSLNNVSIPSLSPLMAPQAQLGGDNLDRRYVDDDIVETLGDETDGDTSAHSGHGYAPSESDASIMENDTRYSRGLESIKAYLRDLYDLSLPVQEPYGGFEVIDNGSEVTTPDGVRSSVASSIRHLDGVASRGVSMVSSGGSDRDTRFPSGPVPVPVPVLPNDGAANGADAQISKRFKDDKTKRARVIREIYETERTYVRGLSELVSIYVKPASQPSGSSKASESVIPLAERKVVFGGVESILAIHRDNFLPALTGVIEPLLKQGDDEDGARSAQIAHQVGQVFRTYIAYMKQYSTYINNFDNALARMKAWTYKSSAASSSAGAKLAMSGGKSGGSGAPSPVSESVPHIGSALQPAQRKRVKHFLKRCKESPMHSQINLESYLLLPVQRVPRYKLLLEDLAMCTPPTEQRFAGVPDALDDAISEITKLASLMNEEKREAESRLRLLHWQQRITSRGPSPLVQPHRKLILDGSLRLIRVVKKASSFVEVDMPGLKPGADGDSTITASKAVVPVDYIKPEPMDKEIMLILCSDMLVLVQKRSADGWDGQVDLFSVLRMATLREPASVSPSNDRVLRVVDNKSIYYFLGDSHSGALQWCRAVNGQNRR